MHVAASTGRMVAGRYLLQHTIGRGAMGTVWRARDTVLARDVAVKEVRLRGPVNAGSVMTEETRVLYQRTLREARTAARLNHPAVVTVFDVVEADGSPWIVMELVDARSLDQVLADDGPLRPPEAAELGMRVLSALACAHAAGILHRDVKPSNVLLGPDGRAVLTDFGIATLEGDSGLTQAGMVMGTPGFTAPERIRGDLASPASDLWSLGATLYAAVEGRGPFDHRGNSIAILAAIANEAPPRPRSAGPLRPVIEALLHRNPQARPDAAAAGRLLAAAGTGAAAGTAPGGDPGPQAAGARAPLLAAPLNVAAGGPQTQAPAGAASWGGAPGPDGRRAGSAGPQSTPPGVRWPEFPEPGFPDPAAAPWSGNSWSGNSWSGNSRSDSWSGNSRPGDSWPRGPQAGHAPWASRATQPGGPSAAGSPPGRHGAPAPGLHHRLAGELAALLPRGRRGLLVLLGAVAIVAAGILVGMALTRGDGTGPRAGGPQPPGVAAGQAGSPAGFTMAVPAGWHAARHGAGTDFTSPAGDVSMRVTPAAAGSATDRGPLRRPLPQALRQDSLPGYEPVGGRPFSFQGGTGVTWQFTWQPGSGGRMEVLDIAFRLPTPAGHQAFLVRESAPAYAWTATRPVFRTALGTFRVRS